MKNRRGLSTVVGAVFFVIAATTVITYISYSMNSIDEFAQSVIVSEAENINRGMEEISISQATISGGEFNATVINTGSLPVKLTRLWVVDEDSGLNSKADLDIMINPGNQDFIDSTGISADSTASYTLKAVTSRGNIATFSVSPDVSTQIQIITPAQVAPTQEFTVVSIITNNSTLPNNIANLVPLITNNASVTQLANVSPPSVAVLPQGNSVTFTSKWLAPESVGDLWFNASYTGAPVGSWNVANMTVAISSEAEEATNSQWSQAATRVGILISGVPNPVNTASSDYKGKWGIGIINPLDRDVDVYSVGITSTVEEIFDGLTPIEPTSGWTEVELGKQDIVIWQGGGTPVTIGAKDVGQFRVETDFQRTGTAESLMVIQALTSEGKLSTIYTISGNAAHPLINAFYSKSLTDPLPNWGYVIRDIPSEKQDQLFNATVYNSAIGTILSSQIQLIILVPSDFTDVTDVGINDDTDGWNNAEISENPDGSHVISVLTNGTSLIGGFNATFQFSADAPLVNDDKLYVFQTTTIYPSFTTGDAIQLASALSEAGVEVVPPP
jgi:hypothetical protein